MNRPILPFSYGARIFLLVCMQFVCACMVSDLLSSPSGLAFNLQSAPETPQQWLIGTIPPFKYRVLFRWIVLTLYNTPFIPQTAWNFYAVYISVSFIFFLASYLALFGFMKQLNFGNKAAFMGCFLFFLSPPVLFAYFSPVMTREDPLAYFLITTALFLLVRFNSTRLNVGLSVLGICARETLAIFPLTILFCKRGVIYRLAPVAAAALTFVGLRFYYGYEMHDVFYGGRKNLANPFESLQFIFLGFGFLWFPALRGATTKYESDKINIDFLRATFWPVLSAVLITTALFGRIPEIRLLFLLYPWIIPLAVYHLLQYRGQLCALTKDPWLYISAAGLGLLLFATIALTPESFWGEQHLSNGVFWALLPLPHLFALVHLLRVERRKV